MTVTWPGIVVAFVATLLGGAGIGGLLKIVFDHLRQKRKGTDDMSLSVVAEFKARLESVEATLERERESRGRLEKDRDRDRAMCDAELRVLRHRVNNGASMIDGLLLLHEMPAGKARAQVALIREQWTELRKITAAEGAIIMAAPLQQSAQESTE